jgi:hypothetical protein
LIIGNSQPAILHIQPGIMEWWNNGIIALHALVVKEEALVTPHFFLPVASNVRILG